MIKTKNVGVGDFAISSDPEESIKTFALGSCVAIVFLYQPAKTVGMIHIALPDSSISPDMVGKRLGYFADTGIPAILKAMAAHTNKPGSLAQGMIVKLAGGANVMDTNNTFNIGKRNILTVKRMLWSMGMGPVAEDVGGSISRTVSVSVRTGKVHLSSPVKGEWEI